MTSIEPVAKAPLATLIEDLRQSCYCGGPVTQCLHCRCAEALGALSAPPAPASGTTEEVERVALAIAQRIDLEHADLEHLHVPTTGIERDDFPDREFAPYLTLARAALAALREDGTKTETGWLIERQDRGAPEWYRLVNSAAPNNFWTKNAAEALRFARRADAEAYCADSGLDDPGFTVHITEHAWGP